MKDAPNFGAWNHETLSKYALEQYRQNVELREALEQLRLDLKDAMKMARQQHNKDDWK